MRRHSSKAYYMLLIMLGLGISSPLSSGLAQPITQNESFEVRDAGNATSKLTDDEVLAIIESLQGCWEPPESFYHMASETITVEVSLDESGQLISPPRLIEPETLASDTMAQLFSSAVAAIMKCSGEGLPLPAGKHESWKVIQIVFRPADFLGL